MFIRLCILLLAQTLHDPSALSEASPPLSLATHSATIEGDGTRGPYELPHKYIIAHSATVHHGTSHLREEENYYINEKNGSILFFEPLKKGETVTIRYRVFPYPILKEYRTRDISSFLQGKPIVKAAPLETADKALFGESGIVVGGAKTFSIGANTAKGFTFDQSLKVNITGDITEGLSISGVLSDENTPLASEGSTQSLEELDRIYVTIQGKGIGVTLGDFNLAYHTLTMPVMKRELLGVTADVRRGAAALNAAYGIPRGKFHSQHLKGSEGKQGPYQLRSKEGEEDIVIIAGTETVFLDGILLNRGEKSDYTMEYTLAQITFSSKQVITDESDIVVDFQYTRPGFMSSAYATKVSYEGEHFTLGSFYAHDGDEVNQAEGFELTDEKKSFLSTLGDDTTMSWMDGGTYVGTGEGDYDAVDSFYVFRGYHGGSWEVTFTYVGEGNGDYEYSDSLSAFEYVGENSGSSVSKILISLPEEHQIAGFELGYANTEDVQLTGELLGSDYDRNILSARDDNDNRGHLVKLKSMFPLLRSHWGTVHLLGDYHYRNEQFTSILRIEDPDFEDRWHVGKQHGKEELRSGGIAYRKQNLIGLTANLSSLKRQHADVTLEEAALDFTPEGLPHIDALTRSVQIRGDTSLTSVKRNGMGISYTIWRLMPHLEAHQEIRCDTTRHRWREAGAQMGFRIFSQSRITLGYRKRLDDIVASHYGGYEREASTTSKSISFQTEEFSTLKSTLSLIQRKRTYTPDFPGQNTELLLIESNNRFIPWSKKLEIETDYSVSGKYSQRFKQMFYEVEENTGDYSRDSTTGNFFPDTLGNYRKRVERIGEGNPVTALRAFIQLRASPFQFIRGSLTGSVEEENKGSDKFSIYTMHLNRFLDDSLTEQGRQSLDASFSWYPQQRTILSYYATFAKSLNNILVAHARRGYADTHEFRIEQRLSESSKLSMEYTRARSIGERISLGLETRERKETYAPSYAHMVLPNLEIRLRGMTGIISIEQPLYYSALGMMTIKSESITPSCTYTLQNSAILDVSLSAVRNRTATQESSLPFDIRSRYPIGITTEWKARASVSLSSMLSLRIIYNGLNRPDKKTLHSANAELRADF